MPLCHCCSKCSLGDAAPPHLDWGASPCSLVARYSWQHDDKCGNALSSACDSDNPVGYIAVKCKEWEIVLFPLQCVMLAMTRFTKTKREDSGEENLLSGPLVWHPSSRRWPAPPHCHQGTAPHLGQPMDECKYCQAWLPWVYGKKPMAGDLRVTCWRKTEGIDKRNLDKTTTWQSNTYKGVRKGVRQWHSPSKWWDRVQQVTIQWTLNKQ